MDSTLSTKDGEYHRDASTVPTLLTANVISHPAPPRRQIDSRSKQRCFYFVFSALLFSLFIAELSSFIFFIIVDVEIESYRSFWETCILFVNQEDLSPGAWSCDAVLGIKTFVIIITIVMVVLHLVYLCRGDRM